jgi:hypothetical protein
MTRQRWLEVFELCFLGRTPWNSTMRNKKILKDLTAVFIRGGELGGQGYYKPITSVQLHSNNKIIGECYIDGTGWFCPNMLKHGTGTWQKISSMQRSIKEHMLPLGQEGQEYNTEFIMHFRHKPMNLKFLGNSGRKFGEWVGAKYSAVGK